MKSIAWAAQSQNEWPQLNFENDAEKGFESFICSEFEVHRKPVATYTFQSPKSEQSTYQPLSPTPENPGHMSWVSFRYYAHCTFGNPIWQ